MEDDEDSLNPTVNGGYDHPFPFNTIEFEDDVEEDFYDE